MKGPQTMTTRNQQYATFKDLYDSMQTMIEAGFSEDQAFRLTLAVVSKPAAVPAVPDFAAVLAVLKGRP
jgi:hypothetical protein